MLMPDAAVAPSDKQALMAVATSCAAGNAMDREGSLLEGALLEFGELCRRTRRSMQICQRALLPPELHADFSLNQFT